MEKVRRRLISVSKTSYFYAFVALQVLGVYALHFIVPQTEAQTKFGT